MKQVPLKLVEYKDKACAIIGDSKHLKDAINQYRAVNGNVGMWTNLYISEYGSIKGWCFPRTHMKELQSIINGQIPEIVIHSEVVSTQHITEIHTIQNLKTYLLENLATLKQSIIGEMDVKSIVKNDTKFVPDDGKRFIMLGCGCGFSYIEFDKRNKKVAQIVEDAGKLKPWIEKQMIKSIDKTFLKSLEACGNPIEAHFGQNLNYKSDYNALIVRYISKFVDIKKAKVWVKNFDD